MLPRCYTRTWERGKRFTVEIHWQQSKGKKRSENPKMKQIRIWFDFFSRSLFCGSHSTVVFSWWWFSHHTHQIAEIHAINFSLKNHFNSWQSINGHRVLLITLVRHKAAVKMKVKFDDKTKKSTDSKCQYGLHQETLAMPEWIIHELFKWIWIIFQVSDFFIFCSWFVSVLRPYRSWAPSRRTLLNLTQIPRKQFRPAMHTPKKKLLTSKTAESFPPVRCKLFIPSHRTLALPRSQQRTKPSTSSWKWREFILIWIYFSFSLTDDCDCLSFNFTRAHFSLSVANNARVSESV